MIFPVIEIEDVAQVGDQTRISAAKSYVSKDEAVITKVEIDPGDGTFREVTGTSFKDWFLDWAYSTNGNKTVRAKVTNSGGNQTTTATIVAVSVADDKLFSSDTDLTAREPDILRYVPPGRATFKNVHRAAQTTIIESLDESGIVDVNQNKLTKAAVVDVTEVRAWSRDLTLHLIFKGLINSVDDVFTQKAKYYESEVEKRKSRAILRLDLDGDGSIGPSENVQINSVEMVRR